MFGSLQYVGEVCEKAGQLVLFRSWSASFGAFV